MVICFALLFALGQLQPQSHASVEGQVVRQGNADPIVRARLVLAKVGGGLQDYATRLSDGAGRFAFRDLTPGTYRLYADRDGYPRTEYEGRITLVGGQDLKDVVLKMIPYGVITGRVFDANHNPVRHAWVRALKASYFYGNRNLDMVNYAETDEGGEYRIFGLPRGSYFVTAIPRDGPHIDGDTYVVPAIPSNANGNQSEIRRSGSSTLSAGDVDPRAFDDTAYLTAYYPGTTDAAAAMPVELRSGSTVTGIDLTVMSATAVHVRGKVINRLTGQPAVQDVVINLVPRNGEGNRANTRIIMGSFDVARVVPGYYNLTAQTTNAQQLYALLPVDVGKQDLDNITVVVASGITLTAHVSIDGGSDLSSLAGPARPFVQLNGPAGGGYSVPIQPNGIVSIPNVRPGDYTFRLFPLSEASAAYVKSARLGSSDALQGVHVETDMKETGLEIVLSFNSGNLDVTVIDDKQNPVPGALVAAVPDAAHRSRSDLYRTAKTDALGHARLQGVPPGDYKVFASHDVDAGAWQDPDIIASYESRGEPLHVTENGHESMTLKLIPPRY